MTIIAVQMISKKVSQRPAERKGRQAIYHKKKTERKERKKGRKGGRMRWRYRRGIIRHLTVLHWTQTLSLDLIYD